jgi:hypothetical protein
VDGVTIRGWGVSGASGSGCAGTTSEGITLELAAVERIAAVAPMAPKRNISRRFTVTLRPPEETDGLSFKGLTADNPKVQSFPLYRASSTVRRTAGPVVMP